MSLSRGVWLPPHSHLSVWRSVRHCVPDWLSWWTESSSVWAAYNTSRASTCVALSSQQQFCWSQFLYSYIVNISANFYRKWCMWKLRGRKAKAQQLHPACLRATPQLLVWHHVTLGENVIPSISEYGTPWGHWNCTSFIQGHPLFGDSITH